MKFSLAEKRLYKKFRELGQNEREAKKSIRTARGKHGKIVDFRFRGSKLHVWH